MRTCSCLLLLLLQLQRSPLLLHDITDLQLPKFQFLFIPLAHRNQLSSPLLVLNDLINNILVLDQLAECMLSDNHLLGTRSMEQERNRDWDLSRLFLHISSSLRFPLLVNRGPRRRSLRDAVLGPGLVDHFLPEWIEVNLI